MLFKTTSWKATKRDFEEVAPCDFWKLLLASWNSNYLFTPEIHAPRLTSPPTSLCSSHLRRSGNLHLRGRLHLLRRPQLCRRFSSPASSLPQLCRPQLCSGELLLLLLRRAASPTPASCFPCSGELLLVLLRFSVFCCGGERKREGRVPQYMRKGEGLFSHFTPKS